ncbi:tape measure protein [Corynebacterium belfantii]|uniref:Tape measure protein n=1 Tax=Corynebacterium belfantii TaxID=2014537 RepID=A0ABS0LCX9_9CORY|nr:tape measure protein [Corynebacterium belfantii]MBG9354325.1 tape measure protein [Corynebacterium belfantii]
MAVNAAIANAWISIVPDTSGIAPGIKSALSNLDSVGKSAGQGLGSSMAGGLSKEMSKNATGAGKDAGAALGKAMDDAMSKAASNLGNSADDGLKKAARKAGTGFGAELNDAVEKSTSGLGRTLAFGGVIGAVSSLTTSAIGAIRGLAGEAVAASDATDKFKKTLDFAGLDIGKIDELTVKARAYADATVYDLGDIQNMVAQLAANGVKDYDQLAEAAGNLNAVAGGNAETFKSVGMVMTQTAGQGKLTTENWNQLTDAIPGASGKIQEALLKAGAFTGNFRDAMSEGEITAEEFNAAVMEIGSQPIAVEAAKSTETFEGMIGNLQAAITGNLADAMNQLKPEIGALVNGFTKVSESALPKVVDGIKFMADALSQTKMFLKENHDWLVPVAAAVGTLTGALTLLVVQQKAFAFYQSVMAAGGIIKWFQELTNVTKAQAAAQTVLNAVTAANPFALIAIAITALVAGLYVFFTKTETGRKAWKAFTDAISVGWQLAKAAFHAGVEFVTKRIVSLIAKFFELRTKAVETVTNMTNDIRNVFSGAGGWLVDAGRKVFEGLLNGMKQKWESVKNWIGGTKDRLSGMFGFGSGRNHANGGVVRYYANGGMEKHIAQIAPAGSWRVWAEPETGGEAYIPLAQSKRARSTAILATVADKFGLTLTGRDGQALPASAGRYVAASGNAFANGGIVSPDDLLRFAKGQTVNGVSASRSLEGAPYAWGRSNWGDCSGTISQFAAAASGAADWLTRKFATMSQGAWARANNFKSGLGSGARFAMGFFNGGPYGGHTAGTIFWADGSRVNVEMGGGRGNGQIGGAAAGADAPQFTDRYWIPLAGGVGGQFDQIASTSVDGVTTDSGAKIDWGEADSLASAWESENKRRARINKLGLPFKIYDTGGILGHGGVAMNLSGKPEVIINNNQLSAINKLANNVGALVQRIGSSIGAFGATAGIKDVLGVAKMAGFGQIVEYIEPTVNAFEKLQDSLIVQQDAASAVVQAEGNLSAARKNGDVAAVAQAEQDLAKARGVAMQAAKATGLAQIELMVTIAQAIGKIFKKIWEGQVKAQVGVKNAIADSLKAVQEWGALVAQQRETVSKLQQQVVNAQIALTKATWSTRLAQADLARTQLEGVKSVAQAEAKLQAERDRLARKGSMHWNDMSLAYDRYRHAERQGMADRLGDYVRATPEILALEHEVNAAKLSAMAKQYKAALAGLEASHAQQMAALNLAQSQLQLAQQSAQLAQMQKSYFGMSQGGALTGANTARLYEEKAKAEGRANRGFFGWLGSFLTNPLGTLKYAFGGGKKADADYARFLNSEIARRTAAGKGLSQTMDPALEAQVRKLFAMGLNEQAQNLIRSSALGAPQRALDEAKEDQMLLAMKQQEEALKASQKRLAALAEFEKKAQSLREKAAAAEAGAASHQYSADALREKNPAVKAATEALARFEAGRARDYAASARGEKTVLNLTVPEQELYTKEQFDALLKMVEKIPGIELRLKRIDAPRRPTASEVMAGTVL